MHNAIGQAMFSLGLVLIGAAVWITCERLHVVRPMCTVDTTLWEDTVRR